ncbi:MAG TPA: Uma2 family endonuclease [Solirubrobacteraceae bacterium]|jgi:Uma2 family endonuclease
MAAQPATTLPVHRIDVETYDRMVVAGTLEGARVELLEGLLSEMSPQSPQHAAAIEVLTRHFANAGARVRVQLPISIPPDSEPEPDLALVAEKPPAGEHARTALLVIEVAVSSQAIDRNVKARLYARAGVPTYWLLDLAARTLEIHTQPGKTGYSQVDTRREDDLIPCPVEGAEDLDFALLLREAGV